MKTHVLGLRNARQTISYVVNAFVIPSNSLRTPVLIVSCHADQLLQSIIIPERTLSVLWIQIFYKYSHNGLLQLRHRQHLPGRAKPLQFIVKTPLLETPP